MVGHIVEELNKVSKLVCCLGRPGIFCKNMFFHVLEFVRFGENKQFFFGLIGKFHEKSLFSVASKACLLKSEKYSSRSSQSTGLFLCSW